MTFHPKFSLTGLLAALAFTTSLPSFAACTSTPARVILPVGQNINLTVTCNAGERFSKIDWFRDTNSASSGLGFAVPAPAEEAGPFHYRTWDKLAPGTYRYRMTGLSLDGSTTTTSSDTVLTVLDKAQAALFDPGGLWVPPGYPNLLVADQMSIDGAGNQNYIPGCIDHTPTPSSSNQGCAANDYYTGTLYGGGDYTFRFALGNTLSLRVTGADDGFATNGYFQLRGATGGNIVSSASLWVVDDPRIAYKDAPDTCKGTEVTNVNVLTWADKCRLITGKRYYVNVAVNDNLGCDLGTACRLQMIESTDSF